MEEMVGLSHEVKLLAVTKKKIKQGDILVRDDNTSYIWGKKEEKDINRITNPDRQAGGGESTSATNKSGQKIST